MPRTPLQDQHLLDSSKAPALRTGGEAGTVKPPSKVHYVPKIFPFQKIRPVVAPPYNRFIFRHTLSALCREISEFEFPFEILRIQKHAVKTVSGRRCANSVIRSTGELAVMLVRVLQTAANCV